MTDLRFLGVYTYGASFVPKFLQESTFLWLALNWEVKTRLFKKKKKKTEQTKPNKKQLSKCSFSFFMYQKKLHWFNWSYETLQL